MARVVQAGQPFGGEDQPARRLTAGERRQQLFTVALRLFAERGYRATTMDDVAEAAGVTKPLLYQHFSSKRALYLELVDSVAQELLAAINEATSTAEGPRQQVERGFAAYFNMVVTHEAAFRLLYGRNDGGDEELGDALRQVEDAIALAIDPLIAAGLDPEHRRFLAYAVVGMAEGASRHWIAARAARAARATGGRNGDGDGGGDGEEDPAVETRRLAGQLADLAWAGLRSVRAG
ncbi:MAG TPA: TetR/AcrR family transcriptional regulator [Acidimicrobiales bacterium]|nr:TetR/AcrR family transcriptional regulator [Acidimicrobiales bacterium]